MSYAPGGTRCPIGRGDEVVQHVADRDRVHRVGRPRRHGDHQEPVADVPQHLERRRTRTDDHRRAQPHHLGTTVDRQRLGDLGPAGEVLGELTVVGDESAQIDDAADARVAGGDGDVGRGAVVGVTEVRLPDAVDQVVDDVDGPRDGEGAGCAVASAASRYTGVTSSNQPKSASRATSRLATTTSCPSLKRAVTSREPT